MDTSTEKWRHDPRLERSFQLWHSAVYADIERLSSSLVTVDRDDIETRFGLVLTDPEMRELNARTPFLGRESQRAAAVIALATVTKPWGVAGAFFPDSDTTPPSASRLV